MIRENCSYNDNDNDDDNGDLNNRSSLYISRVLVLMHLWNIVVFFKYNLVYLFTI